MDNLLCMRLPAALKGTAINSGDTELPVLCMWNQGKGFLASKTSLFDQLVPSAICHSHPHLLTLEC
jgi:hypothetical protein